MTYIPRQCSKGFPPAFLSKKVWGLPKKKRRMQMIDELADLESHEGYNFGVEDPINNSKIRDKESEES